MHATAVESTPHQAIGTRALATGATIAFSVFPVIVVVLAIVQRRDYRLGRQAISELALGTGGALMILAFLSLGTGMVLLALVLQRTCPRAVTARWLLLVASVLAGPMSALFHTDLTGDPTTTHGRIHNTAGLTAFLVMLVVMALLAVRFRGNDQWRGFAVPTMIWTVEALGAFFLIPLLGNAHFGLAQKIFVGSFVGWLIAAGVHARRSTS